MKMIQDLFFELLQVALEGREALSFVPTKEQWNLSFSIAQKQALVGVCFVGIERLPQEQRPDNGLIMQWWGLTHQIEERNMMLNQRSVETCRYFEKQGFRACVLKGQGNAAMYPWPLRRQSGDIDVWVQPSADTYSIDKSRSAVLSWARKRYPKEEYDLKHIHFPIIRNVPMEVHFVPSLLRSPIANRRLKRYYKQEAARQFGHGIELADVEKGLGQLVCPNIDFNLVFQLTHIFDHFISEGVGLRQVMDYFFVMRASQRQERKQSVAAEIKQIGLYGFLEALMWVMHEVLGLKEDEMIAPMDERRGCVLLDEILAGGNFGHYESRYWYRGISKWKFYVARMRRMAHFLRYYPSEVLWDIPFRVRQRLWMGYMGLRTH